VVPYQRIELAMPETAEKAEWIRSETPTKLRKRESLQHARVRGMLGQSAILPLLRRC
jgi:hypothetical protein